MERYFKDYSLPGNEVALQSYINSTKDLKEKYDTIRTGKIYKQEELKELYKPITKPLEKLIQQNMPKSLSEYVENRPKTLPEYVENQPPQLLDNTEEVIKVIGRTAQKYLSNYGSKDIKTDKTFGIRVEDNDLFIGNQPVWIKDDNIIFKDGTEFIGTPGLWELLILEQPNHYDSVDEENYAEILQKTNSYRHNNDPNARKVKASTGYKYNNIVKPILVKKGILRLKGPTEGSGLFPIHNDPIDLLSKLVGVYMNIQNGNVDPENIIKILN